MIIQNQENYTTSKWSGGTTTEIFIYPKESKYSERNFDFRISSAIIEDNFSKFTDLSGYDRIIIPLTNDLVLSHGDEKFTIKKLDGYSFDGGKLTESYSSITDFNLIYNYKYNANYELIDSDKNIECDNQIIFMYLIDGSCKIILVNEEIKLVKGSSLIAFSGDSFKIIGDFKAIKFNIKES
ncbi:MAG: HutD family protein [Candidatus Delongbacteria bacterium]|nr:HutD family protein [Candidatus Delongbacteria bacterium]MBN2833677.1 HutD family protein [Candidatus Delongbacteria bacterium]